MLSREAVANYSKLFKDPRASVLFAEEQKFEDDASAVRQLFTFYDDAETQLRTLVHALQMPEFNPAMSEMEYTLVGHGVTDFNDKTKPKHKGLTGVRGPLLNETGINQAVAQHSTLSTEPYLAFCSDAPRALMHAILRQDPSQLQFFLEDRFSGTSNRDVILKNEAEGIFSPKQYQLMVAKALSMDIIPTPLLRAQFFSHLEGTVDSYSPAQKDEAHWRRDLLQAVRNANNQGVGERYSEFAFDRGFRFFEMLINQRDGVKVPRADLITHSGIFDIAFSYFDYLASYGSSNGRIILERSPSSDDRGKVHPLYVRQVTAPNGVATGKGSRTYFDFVNDPQKMIEVVDKTLAQVEDLRNLSLDPLIRDKPHATHKKTEEERAIVATPLIGFKKGRDSHYEQYSATIDDVLSSDKPVIIFGNGGEGKSILLSTIAFNLAHHRYHDEKGKVQFSNYVPLIFEWNPLIDKIGSRGAHKNAARIDEIFQEPIGHLDPRLLGDYQLLFLIDDYHKVNPDNMRPLAEVVENLARQNHRVVLFSRLERADMHPPVNDGYATFQINREAVPKTLGEYIAMRISDPARREDFRRYASQYDSSITGNFITLQVLTRIYEDPQEIVGYFDRTSDAKIVAALEAGQALTRTQLYHVQTQFVIGKQIFRERRYDPRFSFEQLPELIREEKLRLAQFAFDSTYGPKFTGTA